MPRPGVMRIDFRSRRSVRQHVRPSSTGLGRQVGLLIETPVRAEVVAGPRVVSRDADRWCAGRCGSRRGSGRCWCARFPARIRWNALSFEAKVARIGAQQRLFGGQGLEFLVAVAQCRGRRPLAGEVRARDVPCSAHSDAGILRKRAAQPVHEETGDVGRLSNSFAILPLGDHPVHRRLLVCPRPYIGTC